MYGGAALGLKKTSLTVPFLSPSLHSSLISILFYLIPFVSSHLSLIRYGGIIINHIGVERVRALAQRRDEAGPMLLLPTHRSYIDFIMLSYVTFALNLPIPYIAAAEDFMNLGPATQLLRGAGAFFLKRDGSYKTDAVYNAVFNE